MRCTWVLGALSLVALSAVTPSDARACSPPCFDPPIRLFAPDAQIPGNLIYFLVSTSDPGPLSLKTKSGEVVLSSIRTIGNSLVFAPDAPVSAGTELELTYEVIDRCSDNALKQLTYTFRATEAQSMEVRPTSLSLTGQGIWFPESGGRLSVARVLAWGPDANGGSQHLAGMSASVDGHPVAMTLNGGVASFEITTDCSDPGRVFGDGSCADYWQYFPEGVHTVELRSFVIGHSQGSGTTTLTVTTSCDQECGNLDGAQEQALARDDSETAERLAAPNGADDVTAESATADNTTAKRATDSGGCTTHSGSSSWTSGLLLGLAALSWRRRQRRRV